MSLLATLQQGAEMLASAGMCWQSVLGQQRTKGAACATGVNWLSGRRESGAAPGENRCMGFPASLLRKLRMSTRTVP